MKLAVIGFLLVSIIGGLFLLKAPAVAHEDKHENAECQINNSDKQCGEGLVCIPFNEESGNGKCLPLVSPTTEVTPTEEPTVTPEATPSATPEVTDVPPTQTPSNGAAQGDGLSDGRSDGRSSCPSCTLPPSTTSPFDGSKVGWK